ncbi:MAG TPA: DEAD/DEAH box helicase [Acidimicrobiales bacterium]|nr:DEAD/DEAH box helicase [Acidimicrobiales bacterium]
MVASPGSGRGLSLDDEGRVARIVGFPTWRRGRRYAADGAVLEQEWDATGTEGVGLVDGSGPEPYRVAVHLERGRDGRLTGLDSECTCPVAVHCKHAVALLVASTVEDTPQRRAVGSAEAVTLAPEATDPDADRAAFPGAARTLRVVGHAAPPPAAPGLRPEWERRLAGVLARPTAPAPAEADRGRRRGGHGSGTLAATTEFGLQFELTERPPAGYSRVPAGRRGGRQGLRVRPVTRSGAGNWVRTGISWAQLDSLGYGGGLPARAGDQVTMLRELKALSRLDAAYRFTGFGDDVVWLEAVPSRRLWDLLAQARELGVPLLRAGRDPAGVELLDGRVTAGADLTAGPDGLTVRPELRDDDGRVLAPAELLLIGAPAHGLAWSDVPAADGTPPLHLAPLARPLDAATGSFLLGGAITVAAADTERFLTGALPLLRRRLPVRSSDGTVELPDTAPEVVQCRLHWRRHSDGGPYAELSWDLPDDVGADPVVAAATRVAGRLPALVDATEWGPRLRASATVGGMHAVTLATEVVPGLEAIDGVGVVVSGDVPRFNEADGPAAVRLTGDETPGGDWLDLSVEVRVGDEVVPYRDVFVALAEGREAMVLPSGTWFRLDTPELRRLAELIAEARALHDAPVGKARLSRYQASLWEELTELAETEMRAADWQRSVEALAARAEAPPAPVPAGLRAALRPYQLEGFRWLAHRYDLRLGGILADDMGLGKTAMALTLVLHATTAAGDGRLPWLVVCPTSVIGTWVGEAARFTPDLRVEAVTETAARRGRPLAEVAAGADLVVTSYTLFRLEHTDYAAVAWAGMLLDEAQAVKNRASHANRHARRLPVPFKLAITGTPLENSLRELWAITAITSPGLLGSSDRFEAVYRRPVERDGDPEVLAALRRRLRPVILRRRKADVAAELPDKQEQVLALDLEPRHRAAYDTVLARERQRVLGLLGDLEGNRFEVLRSLTTLRQAALDVSLVDPGRQVPSTKLDALVELLSEMAAEGHRSLVFSQFTRFLTLARHRLEAAGIACAYLDGSTRDRPAVIERWRSGDAPAFLISLKAGGVGLTLTEADHCVLLDPWWNPATEAQAVDRAHRIGQTRKVLVQRMVATGTIEEKVMALKARKAALFDSVVDAGGFESAALSADDVRELLG